MGEKSEKRHAIFGVDPASGPGSFVRATFTGAGELVHLETWPERWDEEQARTLLERFREIDFSQTFIGVPPGSFGDPRVRDPDCPCDSYRPGKPSGDCYADGHYLCRECEECDPLRFEVEEDPNNPVVRARRFLEIDRRAPLETPRTDEPDTAWSENPDADPVFLSRIGE
jgi:hypothetical protein